MKNHQKTKPMGRRPPRFPEQDFKLVQCCWSGFAVSKGVRNFLFYQGNYSLKQTCTAPSWAKFQLTEILWEISAKHAYNSHVVLICFKSWNIYWHYLTHLWDFWCVLPSILRSMPLELEMIFPGFSEVIFLWNG